jgi:hypothetical protein
MKLRPLTAVLVKLLGVVAVFKGLLACLGLWHYSYMFSSDARFSYLEPTARMAFVQMILTAGIQVAVGALAFWKSKPISVFLCRGVDEDS